MHQASKTSCITSRYNPYPLTGRFLHCPEQPLDLRAVSDPVLGPVGVVHLKQALIVSDPSNWLHGLDVPAAVRRRRPALLARKLEEVHHRLLLLLVC